MDLEVQGAQQLEAVAKRLKAAGRGDLRKELLQQVRAAAKPTVTDIKRNAATDLPQRGGLAQAVAKSRIGTRTRMSGKRVGVRIEAKNGMDIKRLDQGRLRHPVFGNRKAWVEQTVKPGWFSEPIKRRLPEVRDGVLKAMNDIIKKVEG
ncbi:hypothetical protein [Nocardioides sp. WS12]|uniref:hypothetical protein n=1 Tax=Nocardioides sp. WS12 TaxID=2486272 RepID=UPI0015F9895A|nr:hypothetical protein [Nocardioides sp. WS12]